VEATSREELMPFTCVSETNDLQTVLTLFVVCLKQIFHVEDGLGLRGFTQHLCPRGQDEG